MRILRRASTFAAPPARVFALLEDARLADQLNPPWLRTAVAQAPWLPKPGARTRLEIHYRGTRFDLETELAEYRRGAFLLERQTAGPFATFEHAVHVDAAGSDTGDTGAAVDGESQARLTEVLAYTLPLGLLGRLFDRVTLRRDLEAALATREQRLRQLLEAG